jgi:hypothetical protein
MASTRTPHSFDVTLKNRLDGGDPVDLSATGLAAGSVRFVAREMIGQPETYIDKECAITAAALGGVRLALEAADLKLAGIWPAGFSVLAADGARIAVFPCHLQVNRHIADSDDVGNPVTVSEIRMALRDLDPALNTLIDDVEFSDQEILTSLTRPVDEWNETPPDLWQYSFTANTFPFREHLRKAACANLLKAAAYRYSRNSLPMSAGGVQTDDKAKSAEYVQLANDLLGQWREFIKFKKGELNLGLCWGMVGARAFRGRRGRTL